jgi:hypothetical protein
MEKRNKSLEEELNQKEILHKEQLCAKDKHAAQLENEISDKAKRIETLENKINMLMANPSNSLCNNDEELLVIDTEC